jgi:hypothetical protein
MRSQNTMYSSAKKLIEIIKVLILLGIFIIIEPLISVVIFNFVPNYTQSWVICFLPCVYAASKIVDILNK